MRIEDLWTTLNNLLFPNGSSITSAGDASLKSVKTASLSAASTPVWGVELQNENTAVSSQVGLLFNAGDDNSKKGAILFNRTGNNGTGAIHILNNGAENPSLPSISDSVMYIKSDEIVLEKKTKITDLAASGFIRSTNDGTLIVSAITSADVPTLPITKIQGLSNGFDTKLDSSATWNPTNGISATSLYFSATPTFGLTSVAVVTGRNVVSIIDDFGRVTSAGILRNSDLPNIDCGTF